MMETVRQAMPPATPSTPAQHDRYGRLLQAAAWLCAALTLLSAAAYGGMFLRGLFRGSRVA